MMSTFPPGRRDYCLFNKQTGPSDKWFRAFEGRHPELKWGVPQMLDARRTTQSTQYIIDDFFNKYGNVMVVTL